MTVLTAVCPALILWDVEEKHVKGSAGWPWQREKEAQAAAAAAAAAARVIQQGREGLKVKQRKHKLLAGGRAQGCNKAIKPHTNTHTWDDAGSALGRCVEVFDVRGGPAAAAPVDGVEPPTDQGWLRAAWVGATCVSADKGPVGVSASNFVVSAREQRAAVWKAAASYRWTGGRA
eukprot:scaffold11757_cov21-Tisochrysis_lutea.AAC.2